MHDHPVLNVHSRKVVYTCVSTHPGAHLRDVARRCGVPLGTALYHLDALDHAGLVSARRDGRYKRFFPVGEVGRADKDLLSVLRHETPRRVVLALLAEPLLTQRDLCRALGLSRSTLSFHAAQLVAAGVLVREPTRPESRYRVREPDAARGVLVRYRDSLATAQDATLFDALIEPGGAAPAPTVEGLA